MFVRNKMYIQSTHPSAFLCKEYCECTVPISYLKQRVSTDKTGKVPKSLNDKVQLYYCVFKDFSYLIGRDPLTDLHLSEHCGKNALGDKT